MTQDERKQIANTIFSQLGGNRFKVMTGAHSFTAGDKGELTFKFPNGKDGFKAMRVELTPMDVYTITFFRFKGSLKKGNLGVEQVEHKNIYAEDLAGLFESETGLRTSL